ncbi:unnamed protein product, partial [Phaedon cochleariae]
VSASCVFIGLGIFALAVFWIRKCRQSSGLPKHEYSALKTDGDNEKLRAERQIRNGAFMSCKQNLEDNERYELKTQLEDIGSRPEKHWFIVQDNTLGAERLLALIPLPSTCPLTPSRSTRDALIELFRGLQHPYVHPVLDVEFWRGEVAVISPVNPAGSLKDLIYGASWFEDYEKKYRARGEGLSVRTIQCLGRQIIEGLIFLRNRYFPPIYHLHSGNVIIQNGVARLAGLENPLLGVSSHACAHACVTSAHVCPAPAALAFGRLLFEMATGREPPPGAPTLALLRLGLERGEPRVAEALEFIFREGGAPSLEELARCELFRGVELRELRGASVIQSTSTPEVMELLETVKNHVPQLPSRRLHYSDDLEPWFA